MRTAVIRRKKVLRGARMSVVGKLHYGAGRWPQDPVRAVYVASHRSKQSDFCVAEIGSKEPEADSSL